MKAKGMHEVHGTLLRTRQGECEKNTNVKGGQKFCTRKYVQKAQNIRKTCTQDVKVVYGKLRKISEKSAKGQNR